MTIRYLSSLAVLLFAFHASAIAPLRIYSVEPRTGPTGGGTVVTIKGTGFADICPPNVSPCSSWPPVVLFGGKALSVELVDEFTLVAVTPPYLPVAVDVEVIQGNGHVSTTGTGLHFTYTGDAAEGGHERILLPIFVPPVRGAFGSEFHTKLSAKNRHATQSIWLRGVGYTCVGFHCFGSPFGGSLLPAGLREEGEWELDGTPGSFLFVRDDLVDDLVLNLRVFDVSRSTQNFGTELPIVYERDMRTDRIDLVEVPRDPLFRNTLRLYAVRPTSLNVKIGNETQVVHVLGGDVEHPAYAVIGELPIGTTPVDITITPALADQAAFWAFVSVTNNETQMITTITPQR